MRPRWDAGRRELRLGDVVVKNFRKHHAPNQELLLQVLEEENWQCPVDNPFPGSNEYARLRDAVRKLNARQRLIRFRLDGTGRAIIWEPCAALGKRTA